MTTAATKVIRKFSRISKDVYCFSDVFKDIVGMLSSVGFPPHRLVNDK